VITRDVAGEALGVTRAEQKQLSDWATRFRERQQAKKGTV
jgi:bifunctional N-acetylglucosamine-1-phosphate-uridyltransferase/glucosamine-1-phosphate-acetyltransferase GlmU-like protein